MIGSAMKPSAFAPLLVLILLGVGCEKVALPPAPMLESPAIVAPSTQPPCLAFSETDGFARWVDAYALGEDETARSLARQVGLPEQANKKLIEDLRNSLTGSAKPSFLCALDDRGRRVAWVTENWIGEGQCRDTFYVSIDGEGTVSDFTADGRTESCDRLCAPKRQDADLLVWQCDLQEDGDKKAWTQLHMSRASGRVDIVKCQKDALGMPVGCVE